MTTRTRQSTHRTDETEATPHNLVLATGLLAVLGAITLHFGLPLFTEMMTEALSALSTHPQELQGWLASMR